MSYKCMAFFYECIHAKHIEKQWPTKTVSALLRISFNLVLIDRRLKSHGTCTLAWSGLLCETWSTPVRMGHRGPINIHLTLPITFYHKPLYPHFISKLVGMQLSFAFLKQSLMFPPDRALFKPYEHLWVTIAYIKTCAWIWKKIHFSLSRSFVWKMCLGCFIWYSCIM